MTDTGRPTTSSTFPLLTSPNGLGLLPRDRGGNESHTRALVNSTWPEIEELLATLRYDAAIDALTALASAMHEATASDDEAWRETLDASRALVYDAIVEVARAGDIRERGITALDACGTWDQVQRRELDARRASLSGDR